MKNNGIDPTPISGTRWTDAGKGASTGELHAAIVAEFANRIDGATTRSLNRLRDLWGLGVVGTNLSLTGAPLNDEDLDRIAKVEV